MCRQAGLIDRTIIDAIYGCAGFSIIVHIVNALGFQSPPKRVFDRAAKFLLMFGYKPLSGLGLTVMAGVNSASKKVAGRWRQAIWMTPTAAA